MNSPAPSWLDAFRTAEGLGPEFAVTFESMHRPLAQALAREAHGSRGLVIGVCGPQGSGKTTLTAALARLLEDDGLKVARLSIDDLYLPREARLDLARDVHPLLATRGPPGTHDVTLGHEVLHGLLGGEASLPRFDKAQDTRAPETKWPRFPGPADIVLFEGWCVGARPQPGELLKEPVNALERDEDPDGVWRGYVNAALAGDYQALFARMHRLILLTAPNFETVVRWRTEQEVKLRARLLAEGGDLSRTMDEPDVARFVAHYERLTRWVLLEAPTRADRVIRLDAHRRPLEP